MNQAEPRGQWAAGLLAIAALLIMTIRFPPSDLSGWISTTLHIPLWAVFLFSVTLAVVGLLLSKTKPLRIANSVVLVLALYTVIITALF